MAVRFLIAYDLHEKKDEDYQKVIKKIKSFGDAIEVQESVWIVYTDSSRADVTQGIWNKMSADDTLLVTKVDGIAHRGQDDGFTTYLSDHPFQ